MKNFVKMLLFSAIFAAASNAVCAASRISQTETVAFPQVGKVVIQAREAVGAFPRIVFTAKDSKAALLNYVISDKGGLLKPTPDSSPDTGPFLRFRVLHPEGFKSPVILAIAVCPGGSDHGFWATVIGEVGGKLKVMLPQPVFANIQGGFYIGKLNKKLGYGLAVWTFVWNDGAHYDDHPYETRLYTLQNEQLVFKEKVVSKRKYQGNGAEALKEIGIEAHDLRAEMPKMKEYIEQ
jgi:hypothetical protein